MIGTDWNASRRHLLLDASINTYVEDNRLAAFLVVPGENDMGQKFILFVSEKGDVYAKTPNDETRITQGDFVGTSLSAVLLGEIAKGYSVLWHVPTDRTRRELLTSIRQEREAAEKSLKEGTMKISPPKEYYAWSDGGFSYFVNAKTGEKKLKLDPDDIEVAPRLDDFCEER